ncbi:hypothetical protein D3C81_1419820 [compost metagenome]
MSDHDRRLHAPGHEGTGERVFYDEQKRLRQCGIGGLGVPVAGRVGQQQIAHPCRQGRLEQFQAGVHLRTVFGLARIQLARHARVLRALAAEHKHQGTRLRHGRGGAGLDLL